MSITTAAPPYIVEIETIVAHLSLFPSLRTPHRGCIQYAETHINVCNIGKLITR